MVRRRDEEEDRSRAPRPKSKPAGKHARLRLLDCFPELQAKFKRGYPPTEIAEWLQETKMECTDISRESLITSLHRYKKDLGPIPLASPVVPEVVAAAEEKIAKGLDELEELEKIFELQMCRVNIGHQFEKNSKILNRFINQEVALAAQILQKRHNIKMDLGYDGGRDLGTLNIRPELVDNLRDRHGEEVVDAMGDAEARGRALSIARSLALLDGEAVEEVLGDDDD